MPGSEQPAHVVDQRGPGRRAPRARPARARCRPTRATPSATRRSTSGTHARGLLRSVETAARSVRPDSPPTSTIVGAVAAQRERAARPARRGPSPPGGPRTSRASRSRSPSGAGSRAPARGPPRSRGSSGSGSASRATAGALGQAPPRPATRRHASSSASTRAVVPAQLGAPSPAPRAAAPRRPARSGARASSSPRRVRRSSTSVTRAGLLAAGREHALGHQVGQVRADPLGAAGARRRGHRQHVVGGVAVAARPACSRVSSPTPSTLGQLVDGWRPCRAGSRACGTAPRGPRARRSGRRPSSPSAARW